MADDGAHRMSRVDTAWLRMDNDVNLMMIVGVWMLASPVTLDAVRERVADKLLKYDRFRQRVVHDTMGASWVEDEAFDLERHVAPMILSPGPGESERQALQRLCGEMAGAPLDARHPLWQFHVIEHYEGGSAMVCRIHHCIGDGIALISVMQSITDGGSDPPKRRRREPEDATEADWLAKAVLEPLTELTTQAIAMYGDGVVKSLEALSHPQQSLAGSLELARTGVKVLSDVAALALLADDSPTRLKGRPDGRKVVAWCEPLPLDEVKAIGKALNCSVNDVLLSCAAGAVGSYLRGCGDDPTGQEIRAMVPVNLRPLEQAWKLGNRFGLAPLVLPIGITNPIERVYAVRQRMAELKGSYQPLLAFAILSLTGLLIKPAQDAILGLFAKKTTAVMTNVPGPAQPLSFCGAVLRQNMFWVPASGDVGMGVSILSYAGGVQFGLITDHALCPDPERIIERFGAEFEQLLLATMMLPWAGQPEHPGAASTPKPRQPKAAPQAPRPQAARRSASPPRVRAASGGRGRAPNARSSASPP
jgi:WS/DGAT/MGAT family acyltransferase